MATLAELAVLVSADISRFEKSMGGMQKTLQQAGKAVGNAGKSMTKWITGPIAGAAAGLFAVAQTTANAGDEIQKMALRTGFSTESLSELKHAAELSGTSLAGMENNVRRMQRSIFNAERGLSTSTEALDALGVGLDDLQGMKPEEQFNLLAGALADVEDQSRKSALAQEIFGRQGTALLPMLANGSEALAEMRGEARDLGLVFSQEAADAAAQFNDDLLRLKGEFTGLFREIGERIIPIMVNDLIPAIRDQAIPVIKGITDRIIEVVRWFSNLSAETRRWILIAAGIAAALGPALIAFGMLANAASLILGVFKSLAKGGVALRLAIWSALVLGLALAAVEIVRHWGTIRDLFTAGINWLIVQFHVLRVEWDLMWARMLRKGQAAIEDLETELFVSALAADAWADEWADALARLRSGVAGDLKAIIEPFKSFDDEIAKVKADAEKLKGLADGFDDAANAARNFDSALGGPKQQVTITDKGLVAARAFWEGAMATGNTVGAQAALAIIERVKKMDTGGIIRGPALVSVGPGVTEAFVQRGGGGGMAGIGSSRLDVSGTIRVEGVGDRGQLVGVTEIIGEHLGKEVQREQDRFAARQSGRRIFR